MHARFGSIAALMFAVTASSGGSAASAVRVLSSIDLSKPFATRSPWRFAASQGPDVQDHVGTPMPGDVVPGAIRLCISNDGGKSCHPDLQRIMRGSDDLFSQPHYLDKAQIVRPRPGRPLLLVQTGSIYSGDGDQRVAVQLLAYDRRRDRFVPVFRKVTGHNNNEEIRYMAGGPLKGAMISAEPTQDAPYGFWISVDKPVTAFRYRQVLRYRSATGYGDRNPLAVIDSEMPNLERRLGLWRLGSPLPLPKGGCPRPRLVRMELWCK